MSKKSIKTILLIEDNPGDARLLREMLNGQGAGGIEMTHVTSMRAAEKHLSEHAADLVLLDLGLADAQGLAAIRRTHAAAPSIPLVVLTGLEDDALAAQALREGAQDYQIKGQVEMRALLRTLNYALERKNLERLKDECISTVSHELRTPLTSISGSLGLLVSQWVDKLPEAVTRLVMIAHANSERLVRLVNDILDMEKVASGQVVFNLSRVRVHTLLERAIADNCAFAEGHGVQVRLSTCVEDKDVITDPDWLAQALTNLLSNAVKFSPMDGEVIVGVETSNEIVRIFVRDHGAGIPAGFKPRIFEKFAQADAAGSRKKGGTGLGLSIVKQIIERLGGKVSFADAAGGGAVFYIDLPARQDIALPSIDLKAVAGIPQIPFREDDRGIGRATMAV